MQQLQEFNFTVLYGFNALFLLIFISTISCIHGGEYDQPLFDLGQRSFPSRVTVLEDKHQQAQWAQPGQQNGR